MIQSAKLPIVVPDSKPHSDRGPSPPGRNGFAGAKARQNPFEIACVF